MQRKVRTFHIGLDDTDSSQGMCTTFLTYNLVKKLSTISRKTRLIDYPNLVRLNPNIPWKTRGNGSLVLRIESKLGRRELFRICKKLVDRYASSKGANAGLVIHEGEQMSQEVHYFARQALHTVLSLREAKNLIEKTGMSSYALGNGQGLVGALAGIGNELQDDYTFELIAYRRDCSIPRKLDKNRVVRMDNLTRPRTFNSYDEENDRVLIEPHGPDPVLLGIRGESPSSLKEAFALLLPLDNLLGYMIFRSNQGTGEHLQFELDLGKLKAYSSGKATGIVLSKPNMWIGGHLFFEIGNEQGKVLCACYEPTGRLRFRANSLLPGDLVEVGGGVRKPTVKHPKVLNVEYLKPLKLISDAAYENPRCDFCSARMSSKGKSQGFQCPKCGRRDYSSLKIRNERRRAIVKGRIYMPDLRAHRHLTKPIQRYFQKRPRKGNYQPHLRDWIFAERPLS